MRSLKGEEGACGEPDGVFVSLFLCSRVITQRGWLVEALDRIAFLYKGKRGGHKERLAFGHPGTPDDLYGFISLYEYRRYTTHRDGIGSLCLALHVYLIV